MILYNVVFEGTRTDWEASILKIPQSQSDAALRDQVQSQSQFAHFMDWQVFGFFFFCLFPLSLAQELILTRLATFCNSVERVEGML